jgi:hypothetical protein
MQHLIILVFLLFISKLNGEYYSYRRNLIRNFGYRLLIACNYKRHKNAIHSMNKRYQEKMFQIEQDTKIKYMEVSSQYYSLADQDRYLIEKMLDLIL